MISSTDVKHRIQSVPSLKEAKEYIYSIDFSMIIKKMISQGWSKKTATALSVEYKHFLFLIKKYSNQTKLLPPSEEVDEFWHNHILDTIKYREDCQRIFGYYFDHYPYFGMDENSDEQDLQEAFNETKKLYLKEFGKEMPKITYRFSVFPVLMKEAMRFW